MEKAVNTKRINISLKLFPWYSGLTDDLLFYIAIDTLFLTVVKNFTAAEIVSITSISQLICIALQFPVLFIIKKIGNNLSIKAGAFFMLLSAVFIAFGQSYFLVLLGRVFHDVSAIFKNASVVALENNLESLDRRGDFVKYRTSANTVYAVLTMLISFVASYMFNLNHYLPMIGCITAAAIGFVLSLFVKDYSGYNKIVYKKKTGPKVKVRYNNIIIIAVILFAMYYSIVSNGQSDGKLFIQENILLDFDLDQTSLIIGAIICVSRIIRVISNIVFDKLYKRFRDKMGVVLPVLLGIALSLLLFGSFIPQIIVKILVMATGYKVILFIRDPFRIYIQDVLFKSTPKEQHQVLLTVLDLGVKIATAVMGLVFSAILLSFSMAVIVAIMLVISLVEIVLCIVLYRAIVAGKRASQSIE